jgi:DegV family protein with EDD domain
MDKKVLIVSDSTSDLSAEIIERYGIKILPLGVNLGEKLFSDGVDITPEDIYYHYEMTGELPKTSAVNMADFSDFFEKYTGEGYSIVCFTISSHMSSTFNNARMAAEDFEDVYVIDSENLSTGSGLLVVEACEMAKAGKSAAEIAEKIKDMRAKVCASFVIDDLEFLHKGGRCSALAAFGANLLKLKPCITVTEGKMGVSKKYRGNFAQVLKTYIAEQIGDGSSIELDRVFVTHAGCDEAIVSECREQVKSLAPFGEVFVTRAGCTVSSHCGKNTLGVLFIKK